jgi:hypothetical protein
MDGEYHELWETDGDGSDGRRVYSSDLTIGPPCFAPDGKSILFTLTDLAKALADRSFSLTDWTKLENLYSMDEIGKLTLVDVPFFHVMGVDLVDSTHNAIYVYGKIGVPAQRAKIDLSTASSKLLSPNAEIDDRFVRFGLMTETDGKPMIVAIGHSNFEKILVRNLDNDLEGGLKTVLTSPLTELYYPRILTYSKVTGKILVGAGEVNGEANKIWIERMFEVDPATGMMSQLNITLPGVN